MGTAAKPTRENRTITVDFKDETTYYQLLGDGKAVLALVLALTLSLGFQLAHQATCEARGCLPRHSHDVRVRLHGVTIWRIQCTTCKAVFTGLPHLILRYRQMRPAGARAAILATHGGLSLELCAVLYHLSPMALCRLVCAFGRQRLVTVLTRCGLSLPTYCLADEKHSRCHTDKVYLPTMVHGRVLWHLGYTEDASAAAVPQSYGALQRAASQQELSYRVRGVLTDGFDSTTESMRTLVPGARLGFCLRRALLKLPKQLAAMASPVRQSLRTQCHTLLYRVRQRKSLRGVARGQRLRPCAEHVAQKAGVAHGERIRRWCQDKKASWYVVRAAPQRPVTSTSLAQAQNAIARKLCAMQGFHHPGGSQQTFLPGLAHLYHLVPYQRRARHAGQCGVGVEGGRVPTQDWFLNIQILTSGGFR